MCAGLGSRILLGMQIDRIEEEAVTIIESSGSDIHLLNDVLEGIVVVPGDPQWDAVRQAWNLAVDQNPAAVVLAETAEDVAAVVGFARDNGLRVAPQGTGH